MSEWKEAVEVEPEQYDSELVKNAVIISIVSLVFVSVFIAMWADYSGILREALFTFSICLFLLGTSYYMLKNSAKSVTDTGHEREYAVIGRGDELAKFIKRAFSGYAASQSILEETLREILIERISVRRRMTVESVRERISTYEGALELVGDEELARLLYEKKKLGGKRRLIIRASRRYREKIERMINKMEEWN